MFLRFASLFFLDFVDTFDQVVFMGPEQSTMGTNLHLLSNTNHIFLFPMHLTYFVLCWLQLCKLTSLYLRLLFIKLQQNLCIRVISTIEIVLTLRYFRNILASSHHVLRSTYAVQLLIYHSHQILVFWKIVDTHHLQLDLLVIFNAYEFS